MGPTTRDDLAREREATELLRTLIRNACVNDGDVASAQEARSADALNAYFAGGRLRCERYAAESLNPGRNR